MLDEKKLGKFLDEKITPLLIKNRDKLNEIANADKFNEPYDDRSLSFAERRELYEKSKLKK